MLRAVTSVRLQFHAEPRELVALAARWARAHDLELVLEQFFPVAQAVPVGSDDLAAACRRLRRVDRVWMCPAGTSDSVGMVSDDHAAWKCDCLSLLVGRRDEAGVRESLLGGASESDSVLRVWRALIRQAKAEMHKGALVRNPDSGAQRQLPAHRHTVGAHQLVEHGVKMLAAAGWNEYAFDDVTPAG